MEILKDKKTLPNLLQITDEFEALEGILEQDQGEITEDFDQLKDFIIHLLQEKTDGCVGYIKSLEDEISSAKSQIENFKKFITYRENAIKNFKKYITMCMDKLGTAQFKGEFNTISKRKGLDKVVIEDEKKISFDFMKTVVSVDTTAIKRHLQSGEKVEGAFLTKNDDTISIRVKGVK